MKNEKTQLIFAGITAAGTAFAGIAGGALSLYQLHVLRKQTKAELAELENKDHK